MDATKPNCLKPVQATKAHGTVETRNDAPYINGKCLVESLVYQATVTTDDNRPSQTYVGLTENTFKTRFNSHKASFNSYQKRNSTELRKYVWDLKRENVDYSIRWKILKRAKSCNCASNGCNL